MRDKVFKILQYLDGGGFPLHEILHFLRIVNDTGYHRQYDDSEKESAQEFFDYVPVEFFHARFGYNLCLSMGIISFFHDWKSPCKICWRACFTKCRRSEEHTSELQSRVDTS